MKYCAVYLIQQCRLLSPHDVANKENEEKGYREKEIQGKFSQADRFGFCLFQFFLLSPSLVEKETMGGGTGRKNRN